jgi:hypothetical protein
MSIELGFETIGNATLIVHDSKPVLATDPWLFGPAYFGSWTLSHEVPAEQIALVEAAEAIWVSHGHPDHLSMPSLERLRDKPILIADHVGGRIRDSLRNDGFDVRVLPDRTWHPLTDRVRVCAIADCNQDAILLVDIDGTLVANLNDASERGWAHAVRKAAKSAKVSFMLALSGYGDADMINFFDPAGERILPYAARKLPPGKDIARRMERLGLRYFVPFASLHKYQRADSVWANDYTTPVADHRLGFDAAGREVLPAFVRYDCRTGEVSEIDPAPMPRTVHEPSEFGDDWSEPLEADDIEAARRYFARIETLRGVLDEIVVRVGGHEHGFTIGSGTGRGVVFDVPRRSFTEAVKWEIFDDLLIGNYMRTTLTGDWDPLDFGREFSPMIAKYADNGFARTPVELRTYLAKYRRRAPLDTLRSQFERRRDSMVTAAARTVRAKVAPGSVLHRAGRSAYRRVRAR